MIWDDLWLRFMMILLAIGIFLLSLSLLALIINGVEILEGYDTILFLVGDLEISVAFVVSFFATLGVAVGLALSRSIYNLSKGKKKLHVQGRAP